MQTTVVSALPGVLFVLSGYLVLFGLAAVLPSLIPPIWPKGLKYGAGMLLPGLMGVLYAIHLS